MLASLHQQAHALWGGKILANTVPQDGVVLRFFGVFFFGGRFLVLVVVWWWVVFFPPFKSLRFKRAIS